MRRRHFLHAAAAGSVAALTSLRNATAQMRGTAGAGAGAMMRRPLTNGATWPTGLPLRRLGILEDTSPDAGEFEGTLAAAPRFAARRAHDGVVDLQRRISGAGDRTVGGTAGHDRFRQPAPSRLDHPLAWAGSPARPG